MWLENVCNGRRREILDEVEYLLSEQSLTEWPPYLDEMCKGEGVVAEDLYWVFTAERSHNFRLRVSKTFADVLGAAFIFERHF